jgi:carbonic anhydrase
MIPAQEALVKLIDGNRRFVAGESAELHRTHKLVDNQEPFAIVVGCSDSRVPPEIVFDQGVGDLFAIRVAGNIVTPLELGGIEFASIKFGPKLVVVLGHTNCGAVGATVSALVDEDTPPDDLSEGMQTIVDHIKVSVDTACSCSRADLIQQTVEANIANSVKRIEQGSSVLEKLIANQEMVVVGALYDLDTGEVHFYG